MTLSMLDESVIPIPIINFTYHIDLILIYNNSLSFYLGKDGLF